MKKFTKLFLSCAAVVAISAAIGVSAMADDVTASITGDVTGTVTINETTGAATISGLAIDGNPTLDSGSQVTFLVFEGKADTDIAAKTVVGIDQGTTVQPEKAGLKTTGEADESKVAVPAEGDGQVTYTVKVGYTPEGGTFTVKSGIFKLGTALGEDFVLGEVDGDTDALDTNDATCVLKAGLGGSTGIGDANKQVTLTADLVVEGLTTIPAGTTLKLGEVDGDADALDTNDATCVLKKGLGGSTGVGYAGQTITGTAAN